MRDDFQHQALIQTFATIGFELAGRPTTALASELPSKCRDGVVQARAASGLACGLDLFRCKASPLADQGVRAQAILAGIFLAHAEGHDLTLLGTQATAFKVSFFNYLGAWRICFAQGLLRKGKSPVGVAEAVAYGSRQAMTRAFRADAVLTPRAWLRSQAHRASKLQSNPAIPESI